MYICIACTILWSRSVCAIRKPMKWSKARKKLENTNKKSEELIKNEERKR